MTWLPEDIKLLKKLREQDGYSFAVCAQVLGRTRNSCICKARRMGFGFDVGLAPSKARTIFDLKDNECRFPTGKNKQGLHVFCGQPAARGRWCEAHAQRTIPKR